MEKIDCGERARKTALRAAIGFLAGVLAAASCVTRQDNSEDQFKEAILPPVPRSYTILEYKNASVELPQWLQYYLDADERLVETLPEYAGDYIFVINEKGTGFSPLAKWSDYFRIEQDLSPAVFLRVYNRLLKESAGRPDYFLGDFFEIFLKKIAGHRFDGPSREADFWIKVSLEQDPAESDDEDEDREIAAGPREEYRYYILAKINRISIQREIMALFTAARTEVTPTALQTGVIAGLQNTLFIGF
jgi:hypothetical protein